MVLSLFYLKIVRRYDIILIQEIRDSKGKAIDKLVDLVNSQASPFQYDYVISERLGRTTSKEQYAFLYRTNSGISVISTHTHNDGDEASGTDLFEREPFMVHFKVTSTEIRSFVLVGIHTKPEKAVDEINHLVGVFSDAQAQFNTPNVMIMGDLNADCTYVGKRAWEKMPIRHDPEVHWLVGDEVDTTVSNTDCAYDRVLVMGDELVQSIIPNSAKVFDFQTTYGIDQETALDVSDHFPVEVSVKSNTTSGVEQWQQLPFYTATSIVIVVIYKVLQRCV
ncbi:hypothetical protein FSP39_014584 [Pinctada imbricata]|uniref:Deoxyribonuclease n=1 Tax=Pinctada imbricata TaxID=66713 RepID=A0AA88Y3J7_PINIB|nr:hypothetical protein FSP39_014584 [Pinctada imbricata]